MQKKTTKLLVTISAIVFAICGLILIFIPKEVSALLTGDYANSFPLALSGSAMLGFASMNWIARHSILGGIYGRAVVAGNQTHSFIGAMVLLRLIFSIGISLALIIMLSVYVLNAILFSYLMFGASGIDQQ